jgi:hypothetical protein
LKFHTGLHLHGCFKFVKFRFVLTSDDAVLSGLTTLPFSQKVAKFLVEMGSGYTQLVGVCQNMFTMQEPFSLYKRQKNQGQLQKALPRQKNFFNKRTGIRLLE